VLLLDEPTEGIQPPIIKDLARLLRDIRSVRNICIVVCEQVLSFVLDVADRILVMEGRPHRACRYPRPRRRGGGRPLPSGVNLARLNPA
jgi:energy-coupling factor transporter ATP-binding protein EcfA2